MPTARPLREYLEVKRLQAEGLGSLRISRRTGLSRGTVGNWMRRDDPPRPPRGADLGSWAVHCPAAYSYLLGVYLGDGHVAVQRNAAGAVKGAFLRIVLDSSYPEIIDGCIEALALTFPDSHIGQYPHPGNAVYLQVSTKLVMAAFPQHGPGRKHQRKIALEPWQREITERFTRELIRGLIHSDGSRCINRFKTKLPSGSTASYAYPRYFFTNYSADIRKIFCEHCELLGIGWTQSSFKNISISHRKSVAILDSFVGPKC